MASKYKRMDLLKSLPFYSEEIKNSEKNNKKISNIGLLSELPFFDKEPKELTNIQLSKELLFHPLERKKRPKRLTKHQILQNVLPLYDSGGIFRREHTYRGSADTYDVEVIGNKSLDDSLFLAKRSINDLFRDILREKRGFKYNLLAIITLKTSSNATNSYDIQTVYLRSKAIAVINQRFNLNSAHEKLKHKLDIWSGEGSGWIVDKIEDLNIEIANYDPLAGSSYIQLPSELNNSMKGLTNIKNKDSECFKWCHVRFINPKNSHPERIKKQGQEIAKTLDYRGISFPMKARGYEIIKERFNINVNVFGCDNRFFPLYVPKNLMNKF